MDKKVSIIEENKREYPEFQPSDREREVIASVFYKFRAAADDRNRSFKYFDGETLIDYINDSVHRFVTNLDEREDMEDWQARIHDPFTRNKVLAVLSKVVRVLPIANFTGRGDEDVRKGILLTNLYEYAEELDDYEELMVYILLEAIVKGTAIGYEGLERKERMIRDVRGADDKITVTEVKEIKSRLFGAIVPLEEFYPSSVGIRNIKLMPFCFWRKEMPYSKFMMDWGMYAKSKFVQPKQTFADEVRPYWADMISSDVQEGNVELIRYYNKDTDEYVIVANGVWLNPIRVDAMTEVISPLPFNHKELPFWDIKYDFFGSDFFYGKSLPDRLKSLQDVLNVLTNMLLDQSFLTIFPPLLTNGYDSIEDDYLRPGRRTPIDTQGLSIKDAFMKLDLGTPSGWHQYILEYTRKIMEQASVDSVSQGQAGVGDRTTAAEIRTAADAVATMLNLFARMVNYGIKRKAYLKASNILQFWTDPQTPMIQRVGGKDKAKDFFNEIKVENTQLSNGKRGTKVIEMYADKSKMPSKANLKARSVVGSASAGKEVEITALPGSYLRNFCYDVKIVANPKQESTKEMEKALQLEKVRVYLSFFPELINKQELAAQTAEKMGDDPSKVLKDFDATQMAGENPEQEQPMGTEPQGNDANNMVRSARGGEMNGMAEMMDLSNNLTG